MFNQNYSFTNECRVGGGGGGPFDFDSAKVQTFETKDLRLWI